MHTTGKPERLLFLFCPSNEVQEIMQEIEDWAHPQANHGTSRGEVLTYGQTDKAHQGFLLFHWSHDVPARLIIKLMQDQAISDFFLYERSEEHPGAL